MFTSNFNVGQQFVPINSPMANLNNVAISTSGQYQTITGIYLLISNNYGVTWTQKQYDTFFSCVEISSSGQYQLVGAQSALYLSNDFGITWNSINSISIDTYNTFTAVAISASGQYQSVTRNGSLGMKGIYISSDYGTTFINTLSPEMNGKTLIKVKMSGSGQYQTVLTQENNIYTSTNYGVTWALNNINTNNLTNVSGLAMCASGQYQTISFYENIGFYISSDFGNTWSFTNPLGYTSIKCVDMSASGQHQIASGRNNGTIWVSSDYGKNWTSSWTNSSREMVAVAISGSGQYQTALSTISDPAAQFGSIDYIYISDSQNTSIYQVGTNKIIWSSNPYVSIPVPLGGSIVYPWAKALINISLSWKIASTYTSASNFSVTLGVVGNPAGGLQVFSTNNAIMSSFNMSSTHYASITISDILVSSDSILPLGYQLLNVTINRGQTTFPIDNNLDLKWSLSVSQSKTA